MDTTSSLTVTPISPTPASARKRKTHSIIFSSSSSASPSLSSSHTTTEGPILSPLPLRIMTKNPSTNPDQSNASLHSNAFTTVAATANTAVTSSTTNRRQFRVSVTFGGSGSNSGSGSSLLTFSTPSSASSPLSPLAETLPVSPTILSSTQFPFSPDLETSNWPSSPSSAGASSAARKISPTQGYHPPNTSQKRTETETDSGASVKGKTAQDTNASSSSPTPLISSPLKSSTFGNFYFLPTDTADAPSSPLRKNLMGGTGNSGRGVGPLDCAIDSTVHPLDRPTLASNPLMSDIIMEEDEEQPQQQQHPLDPSPRLRQQGSVSTAFTTSTALNRPRARYTFGYDEPLVSSLPPRENSISSSSSSCSSPTSPRSPATTASLPPPKIADMKKKSSPQQDVLSTLPLSSAAHSPRLHSTSSPSTPPSSSSPTHVYSHHFHEGYRPPRSLQRVPSKSMPRPPPLSMSIPPEIAVPASPPASPRLSGRKRFSFLTNLMGTTPPPPWLSSTSSFDSEKPLPATPPAGSSQLQLHRHYSLQQQQRARPGSQHQSSTRPQKFKNASAIDLPSYASSMTPSTTTSTTTATSATTNLNQYQDMKSLKPPTSSKLMTIMNKNRGGSNASMKALYDHYDDRNHSNDHQDTLSIYHLHENYYSQEGEEGRSGGDGGGERDRSNGRSHQSLEEDGISADGQAGDYLSPSSTNPYSVSQTSLKIQILPSISQYALHRQQPYGTTDGGGVSNGQSKSRSRLDLTIVLVPEISHVPDDKLDSLNNNFDPSKMNSPQAASPRKGKKRCASLSIFRYFLKK